MRKASEVMEEIVKQVGFLARIEPHPKRGVPSVVIESERASARAYVTPDGGKLTVESEHDGTLGGRREAKDYRERLQGVTLHLESERYDPE